MPVSSDIVASWPRSAWLPQAESSHSANHWLTVKFLGGCVRLDTAPFDRRETYVRVHWGPGTSALRLAGGWGWWWWWLYRVSFASGLPPPSVRKPTVSVQFPAAAPAPSTIPSPQRNT